ncbi:hypothetical protein EX30DRAFT_176779 [Ascodesmis nigricans]|uniref:Telomeric single stranded DNA binding POT1/Cdc13 domain-containing protein n=1 Tax=Ascodesmis nigricans TaxID=341454 RepID=A0A4S2MLB5_9PEZI|nr:hypothetical protein EX30DRAFT_176779 [Ascodesmis nigricans]
MSNRTTPPHPAPPWPSARLPLANLSPEIASAHPSFIKGVTTLIWPFSQSAQTFSILLCEEDFRLRMNRGQLRLNFKGPSAKEVATRVDIGNKVALVLEGVEWEELGEATKRDVPWSVNVRGGVRIKIQTDTGEENIKLEAPIEPAEEDHEEEEEAEEEHEEEDSDHESEHKSPLMTPPRPSDAPSWASQSWKTPGIFKRPIEMLSDSPLFPTGFFGEEEDVDYEAEPAPRKKMRFSQSFRMHSRSPSPTPNVPEEGKPIPEEREGEEEEEHVALRYQDEKVETSDEDINGKLSVYKDPQVDVKSKGVEKEEESSEHVPEPSNVDVEMKDGDEDDTLAHTEPQKPEDEPSETSETAETSKGETSDVDHSTHAVASDEDVGTDRQSSHNDGDSSQTPSQSTENAYQLTEDTDEESAQSERSPSPSSGNERQDVKPQDEVPMRVVGTLATPPETQKAAELQEPEPSVRSNEDEDTKVPHFEPESTPPDTQPSPMEVDDNQSIDERAEDEAPQSQPRTQEIIVRDFAVQPSSDAPAGSQNDTPTAMRDSTSNDEDTPTTEQDEDAGAETSSSLQSPAESPEHPPQTEENIHPRTPSPEHTLEPAADQTSSIYFHAINSRTSTLRFRGFLSINQ